MGGLPSIRHNEVKDLTAHLLKRVAHQVTVEPHLQPLTIELHYRTAIADDQACLDVAASGIWGGRFERTFIDVRVFNPHAPLNCSNSLAASYVWQEKVKRRSCDQQIHDVEHASFVPAIFSTTGGMAKHAIALYKRITSILAEKTGEKYSVVMASIHCRISFVLLQSSIMCLRGSRMLFANVTASANSATLVAAEAAMAHQVNSQIYNNTYCHVVS